MVVFCGEDNYESYLIATKHLKLLLKNNGYKKWVVDADENFELGRIIDEITNFDLFGDKKIVFLKRVSKNSVLMEELSKYFDKIKDLDLIIWDENKIDLRFKFYKNAKENNKVLEFELPKKNYMLSWISSIAKAYNVRLSDEDVEYLYLIWGTNKWGIVTEVLKIKCFTDSSEPINVKELINESTGPERELWDLIRYFSNREGEKFINELTKVSNLETKSQLIISLLHRELRNIGKVLYLHSNNGDYSILGLHPYTLKLTLANSSKYSIEKIVEMLKDLMIIDNNDREGTGHFLVEMTQFTLKHL